MAHVRLRSTVKHPMKLPIMNILSTWIFTRENLYALLVCLILIAITILTADHTPQWIYQGF